MPFSRLKNALTFVKINDPGKLGWCAAVGLMNRGPARSAMVWCMEVDEDEE